MFIMPGDALSRHDQFFFFLRMYNIVLFAHHAMRHFCWPNHNSRPSRVTDSPIIHSYRTCSRLSTSIWWSTTQNLVRIRFYFVPNHDLDWNAIVLWCYIYKKKILKKHCFNKYLIITDKNYSLNRRYNL
jgi:hypothetical protein